MVNRTYTNKGYYGYFVGGGGASKAKNMQMTLLCNPFLNCLL